VDTL